MDFELSSKRLLWQTWTSWGREKLCRMKNNLIMTREKTYLQALHGRSFSISHWTHRSNIERQVDWRVPRTSLRLVLNIWAAEACVDEDFPILEYENNEIAFLKSSRYWNLRGFPLKTIFFVSSMEIFRLKSNFRRRSSSGCDANQFSFAESTAAIINPIFSTDWPTLASPNSLYLSNLLETVVKDIFIPFWRLRAASIISEI